MDLRTHLGVIWRFRVVAVCGLAFALGVTFLSVYRVSFAHGLSISHRQGETWQSTETLFLAPPGSCLFCPQVNAPSTDALALYANSFVVKSKVLPNGKATPASGDYLFSTVTDTQNQPLPYLRVDGTANSARRAKIIASLASNRFIELYAKSSSGLRASQRFVVQVFTPATDATVISSRKLTVPIFIFLAAMIAVLGLVYLLENLRPRAAGVRASSPEPKAEHRLEPKPPDAQPGTEPAPKTEPRLEAVEPKPPDAQPGAAEPAPKADTHLEAVEASVGQSRPETRRPQAGAGAETTPRRT